MTSAAFDEHVASQPDVVARLARQGEVPNLDPQRPVVFAGIGTSWHACRVAAAWTRILSGGRVRAYALDAHDLALTEGMTAADQVVVVSHRGTKQRPTDVLRQAAAAGARTVAVTGEGADPDAEAVVHTVAQERANTHTVSYLAALTVLARMVHGLLGRDAEPLHEALQVVPDAMRRTLDMRIAPAAVGALTHSGRTPVLIAGSGLDTITAHEAALKIKEGTYRWAEGVNTEFALHGMPAVYDAETVAYLLSPVHDDAGRTAALTAVLQQVGARVVAAGESALDVGLPFAEVPMVARPFVSVLPFQRLVSAAAAVLGASPDHTHSEAEPWHSAIAAVEL